MLTSLLDDFFVRALIAGVGVALVAGPFGCFIVWRRMAFFGDTLAHAALLGAALALLLNVNSVLAVFAVGALISLLLVLLQTRRSLSTDVLLGLMSHGALAIGLVVLGVMSQVRVDLMAILLGDILSVTRQDLLWIYLGGAAVLAGLAVLWRPLFAATVNSDIAEAEGLAPDRSGFLFTLLLAVVIAIAMKIVGVLLISALLIIPAAIARRFAASPEQMAVLASGIGAAAVVAGLFASAQWDSPSGPSIIVAGIVLFTVSLALPQRS